MFNPEFRYLLAQDERNGQMMPLIDPHVFTALFVCGINGIALATTCFLLYNVSDYVSIPVKNLLTPLWNSLTPGNELVEMTIIISSIICSVTLLVLVRSVADVLESGFTKLRNEIKEKDERIRELEEELLVASKQKSKNIKFEQ